MVEKKPEFEPWNKEERQIMNLSLGQEQQKRLTKIAEARKIKQGLVGIDKEVAANIAMAHMKLKAAEIELEDLLFDKKNNITINRLKLKLMELEGDIGRCNVNIKNFEFQIKEGKPKQEENTMAEEPEVVTSPEETKEEVPEAEEKTEPEANAPDNPDDVDKAKEEEAKPNDSTGVEDEADPAKQELSE